MNTNSLGVKVIVICGLALAMTIPSFFVESLVHDRTQRAAEVTKEISAHVGGQQTFLGPTLAVPYVVPPRKPSDYVTRGTYLIFAAQAIATVRTTTTERHRSLFKVPVFQADLRLESNFDLKDVTESAPEGAQLDWSAAEIVVGVSDSRGALADGTVSTDGATATLLPGKTVESLLISTLTRKTGTDRPLRSSSTLETGTDHPLRSSAEHQTDNTILTLLGAKAGTAARPGGRFRSVCALKFSGAERIALLPYGKSTRVSMRGDWKSPGFDGAILPVSRTVSDKGFTAEWSVPFIARGTRSEMVSDASAALGRTALGVSFIEVANAYQSVSRSLKYVLLFLGLVFLSYLIFEVTSGKRVHPAQYILVGIAQLVFYLLLLSIAERIGFDLGFLVAALATITLLSANAGWIFASRSQAVRAFFVFSLLYTLIYLLLRLEDNALLVGATASFVAVAAAMYFTRGVDWYNAALRREPVSSGL